MNPFLEVAQRKIALEQVGKLRALRLGELPNKRFFRTGLQLVVSFKQHDAVIGLFEQTRPSSFKRKFQPKAKKQTVPCLGSESTGNCAQ